MNNTNLSLWLDASDASSVTLNYVATGTTGTGSSGSGTITSAADISATTPIGSLLRLGSDVTNTYTVTAISGTSITVTPLLASAYSAVTINRAAVSQLNDKSGVAGMPYRQQVPISPVILKMFKMDFL